MITAGLIDDAPEARSGECPNALGELALMLTQDATPAKANKSTTEGAVMRRRVISQANRESALLYAAAMLLASALLLILATAGHAQSVFKHFLSVNSTTNSTLVHGGPTLVTYIVAGNDTTTLYWLKLYAKATAPTCGTDTPVATFPIPPTPASGTAPPLVIAGGALQSG